MADAKPKIDLKARLGRKSGAPSAAPPPPASVPGVASPSVPVQSALPVSPSMAPAAAAPAPIARNPMGAAPASPLGRQAAPPPAGLGGPSIPPPPGFGAPAPRSAAPQAAAPAQQPAAAARPATAAPLQIRMDIGEEVVEARKAGRKKTMLLAAVTCVLGVGLGFVVGQGVKGNEGAQAAIQGAESLIGEIDAANVKIAEMDGILKSATDKVRGGEYPDTEIEALGGLDIPFDGSNLVGKGIGRFNQTAVTMLMQYANGVEKAEAQRDKIRRLFGALKPQLETINAEKKTPKAHWGAVLANGPKGPWIALKKVEEFELGKDWPDELAKTKRYTKGDPTRGDSVIFPIDPKTEAAVCPSNLTGQLGSALMDLRQELKGDSSTPGREVMGLEELGDKVADQLRKIGGPG